MRWTLRRQILVPMAGILLLTIAVVSALNAALATARVKKQLHVQLADVIHTFAATNIPPTSGVLQQTRGLSGAEFVATDEQGELLAASNEQLSPTALARGPRPAPLDWQTPVRVDSRSYLHAASLVDRRSVNGGRFVLHAFYPEAQWREARWQAIWPPLALGGTAVVLVAIAAYLVAAHITQPIERLRSQVGQIAEGRFAALPLPTRDDEIRALAAAVNQMAERLARYEQAARQSERLKTLGTLGGGIAHQIRNAATGCRIALDLHERDCPLNSNNGHADEPLSVAVRQLELIEQHIQQFLTLGRPAAAVKRPAALAQIARQAIDLVRPTAQHLGVELELRALPEPVAVRADAAALVQLIVNLLINGVEAAARTRIGNATAPPQGAATVAICLSAAENRCELAVVDPGSGPAPQLQPRLFEPFATDKPGGTGLGLAVAQQIAADHGGLVRWDRRSGETWFIVELPEAGQAKLPAAGNAQSPAIRNALCGIPPAAN